jgi:6-phosphogluconolactonase
MLSRLFVVLWVLLSVVAASSCTSIGSYEKRPSHFLVYLGTYTGGESEGIYVQRLNMATGALTPVSVAKEVVNPSFLAIHPSKKFLFAVNEVATFDGKQSGAVSAFAIDQTTGALSFINQRASLGGAPCHIVVDKSGRNVLVANYSGGSVSSLPIGEEGRLGEATGFVKHAGSSVNPNRQEGPHAHSINLDAANRFAFAADLGLDQVIVYAFDPEGGTLRAAAEPATVAPGAGPRHFAFHPSGRFAYVINELDNTVTAFAYEAENGELERTQTISTLPTDFTGRTNTADVQVHPSGQFLYGSNRGHDSIVVFRIDAESGRLTVVEHESTQGKAPRSFGIDPTGTFLLAANQGSDTVVAFRIDPKTGALNPTGHVTKTPTPVCVKFLDLGGATLP